MHGNALRTFRLRPADNFAKPSFGVLECPLSGSSGRLSRSSHTD
jgi:hypothetical protein